LKVSANVKIAMQCFENFGGTNAPNAPPGCAPGAHAIQPAACFARYSIINYLLAMLCEIRCQQQNFIRASKRNDFSFWILHTQ